MTQGRPVFFAANIKNEKNSLRIKKHFLRSERKMKKNSPENKKHGLPKFDPNPSGRFAAEILEKTGQKGVLIGRLAVWAFLEDTSEHGYTKDLDMAVSVQARHKIVNYLGQNKDVTVTDLPIGGINVKTGGTINIDFIDRSSQEWGDYGSLFEEAVNEATESGRTLRLDDENVLHLVSVEYLVLMKLLTMEKKDEDDAKLLLRLAGPDIGKIRAIISNHHRPLVRTRLEIIRTRLEIILRDMNHKESRILKYRGIS